MGWESIKRKKDGTATNVAQKSGSEIEVVGTVPSATTEMYGR